MNNTEKLIELHREFARCYELSKESGAMVSANVQIEGQAASGLSLSNAGLCVNTTE
jgi:hypothetical protein